MKNRYLILFIVIIFQSLICSAQSQEISTEPVFKAGEIKKHSAKIYYYISSEDHVMVFYRAVGELDWHSSKLKNTQSNFNFIKLTNLQPAEEYEYIAMVLQNTVACTGDLSVAYKISGTFTTIDYACPLPGYGSTLPKANNTSEQKDIVFQGK